MQVNLLLSEANFCFVKLKEKKAPLNGYMNGDFSQSLGTKAGSYIKPVCKNMTPLEHTRSKGCPWEQGTALT